MNEISIRRSLSLGRDCKKIVNLAKAIAEPLKDKTEDNLRPNEIRLLLIMKQLLLKQGELESELDEIIYKINNEKETN